MIYTLFTHMEQCTEESVKKMLPLVSAQRREQALRYKHTQGQFCNLQSYRMLQMLIGAVSPTMDGSCPTFNYNEDGKPTLRERPDIHFSISHTKNGIIVAISDRNVGIDVEQIRTASDELIDYTMSEREQQQIRQAAHPNTAFTALWTRKEALMKLIGTGIKDNLRDCLRECDAEIETTIREDLGLVYSIAQYKQAKEY